MSKSPQIYNRLEGIPVDFFNKEDDKLDPYYELHIQEDKLVSENPQKISKEALWLNIRRVFSQPSPVEGNEKVIYTFSVQCFLIWREGVDSSLPPKSPVPSIENPHLFKHLHPQSTILVHLPYFRRDIFIEIKNTINYFFPTKFHVGTFLYRKLGRIGLVLYLQTFRYKSMRNIYNTQPKVFLDSIL